MAFTLKSYIKRGLIAAVGKMADYQIILNSAGSSVCGYCASIAA